MLLEQVKRGAGANVQSAMDRVELTLPRQAVSVSRARGALHPLRPALGDRCDDAVLLVSELASNAVRHGSGPTFRLTARMRGRRCRVDVVDDGDSFVPPSQPAPPEEVLAGRGLTIVDALSDAWGVDDGEPTHVWFEIEVR